MSIFGIYLCNNRVTAGQVALEVLKGASAAILASVFIYTLASVFAGFACHFATACTL